MWGDYPVDKETDRRVVSLGTNGRHRRRGLLRRAGPAAATAAGSLAIAMTIGTAAFWMVTGDRQVPFGGFGPGSTGAARPSSELSSPTGATATSTPRGSSDSTAGQAGTAAGSAIAGASVAGQTTASRRTSQPHAAAHTPRPKKTTTKRPHDKPSPSHTTPPPLVDVTTPPSFLPASTTVSGSSLDLP